MRAKSLLAALLLPVLSSLALNNAQAASCNNLRTELLKLSEITGNTAETRRYANAIAHQKIYIRKLNYELQRNRCSSGSIIVLGSENNPACGALQNELADAEATLDRLDDQKRAVAGNLVRGSEDRLRIVAELQSQNCDFTASVQEASLVTVAPVIGDSEFYTHVPSPEAQAEAPTSPLRTLCVRTCDGAFFPISANASQNDFTRDGAICNRMCPGAETRLYYHPMDNAESADMVDAETGEAYRALPNAFAYTNRLPGETPVCGCGNNSAAFSTPGSDTMGRERYAARIPVTSPLSDEKLQPKASLPAEPPVPDRPYAPSEAKVRVIGPQFMESRNQMNRDLDKDTDAEGKIR